MTTLVTFAVLAVPREWREEFVGQTVLVVRGSKKGAIRSVEVTGSGWKPAVRGVPLLPVPKK